jgi:uncharacterized protein
VLNNLIKNIVSLSTRVPWLLVIGFTIAATGAGLYTATHFAINTDINKLISSDLDWRQREQSFEKEFPGHVNSTLIVVDAPTPELASAAGSALAQRLSENTKNFKSVADLNANEFLIRNGLLFQSKDNVAQFTNGLKQASPLINALHEDPSLRGLVKTLSLALTGVQYNKIKLDDLTRPLSMAADTIDGIFSGRPAAFSWLALLNDNKFSSNDLRYFIEVQPVLDFSALEPGRASSNAIRQAASDLDLVSRYQARVRLTGIVPMGDQEFATVREGALVNGIGTILVVLLILWLALRSPRTIGAVFFNLMVGLVITSAIGLWMVKALNMISVAFAVLFVGLGVDFAIQFTVRYRAERHDCPDLRSALARTGEAIGAPLTLAAAAVAAGFMSFLPTDYRGLSELGQIAGLGMLVAYATSITLLPALLTLFNPPGEPEPLGYRALAPVDDFLQRHRIAVVVGTTAVVMIGAPFLYFLTFDFDPVHLRSRSVESVSTLLDVENDPRLGINAINIILPSLDQVPVATTTLSKLPQVAEVNSVNSFVPKDQSDKLSMIRSLSAALDPILQRAPGSSPTDTESIAALKAATSQLNAIAAKNDGIGAQAAKRLATDLAKLAVADKSVRLSVQSAFIEPFLTDMKRLRGYLGAQTISVDNLPVELKRQWVTPDGKARVQVSPRGNTNDTEVLRNFAKAVSAAYPNAIGGPVSILKSGETIVRAFIHAGGYALISIAILLWIVLRRFGDVLLTLVPLVLAGVVTLELCVIIGLSLNFANIIALPLLLGVGVAFKIYYIMAWRAGQTKLLQSSLTHAVIWSALTTATAFGSLWLSSHPGTSSMGKLLALSLVCTLGAAVLFQPALMGAPRDREKV